MIGDVLRVETRRVGSSPQLFLQYEDRQRQVDSITRRISIFNSIPTENHKKNLPNEIPKKFIILMHDCLWNLKEDFPDAIAVSEL